MDRNANRPNSRILILMTGSSEAEDCPLGAQVHWIRARQHRSGTPVYQQNTGPALNQAEAEEW